MHWCEPMLNCLDCFVGIYTANKMMIALVGKYTRIFNTKGVGQNSQHFYSHSPVGRLRCCVDSWAFAGVRASVAGDCAPSRARRRSPARTCSRSRRCRRSRPRSSHGRVNAAAHADCTSTCSADPRDTPARWRTPRPPPISRWRTPFRDCLQTHNSDVMRCLWVFYAHTR